MQGIYFHWPFCLKKCPYCDFFTTYPFPRLVTAYFDALIKELNSLEQIKSLHKGELFEACSFTQMSSTHVRHSLLIAKRIKSGRSPAVPLKPPAYLSCVLFKHQNFNLSSAKCSISLKNVLKSREQEITSIYFGGGTPSLLTTNQLAQLIQTVQTNFNVTSDAEITLEANPQDLTAEILHDYKNAGINRLSLGGQSFLDDELRLLGRGHSGEQTRQVIDLARRSGFDNISVDLIFALPQQDLKTFENNLKAVVMTEVEHLSLYGLTWEKNTVFSRRKKQHKLIPLHEEEELAMYRLAQEMLPAHGYQQYEISSFARDGYHSRHNSLYWQNLPYWGLGASAASYDGNTRKQNVKSVRQYIKLINADQSAAATIETLEGKAKMAETIFLALRTGKGVDKKAFAERFNEPIENRFSEIINDLAKENLLINTPENIYIPQNKLALADAIVREFL